ncbi:MAG TPA: DNA-processing protein DprA [Fimbriimonadaceae bacterium]|jgi:DNA processing protein
MTRRDFALYLTLTPGIGGRTVTRVLNRNDMLSRSPEAFLSLSPEALREEYGLRADAAERIAASGKAGAAKILEEQKRLVALGVTLVTQADAHYPTMIEEMDPDPPNVLFFYGNHKLLSANTYSVLSSRNTSLAGLDEIEKLTEDGVLKGEVLVSSDNRPEFQRAALVPLRWGAPRILCLDRGLFEVLGPDLKDEPFRAARLWRYQFDPSTDLVISPFRPEAKFSGVNNQVRDRLVACLSRRLDFVEIAPTGNMEKLAKLALKAGRKVRVSDRSINYRRLKEIGAEVISA